MKTTNNAINEGKKQISGNATGEAYTNALQLIKQDDPYAQAVIGDYLITIAFEKAAGWYVTNSEKKLIWQRPKNKENVHCEVIVQDRNDLRFIPFLDIYYSLFDAKENEVIHNKKVNFIWHPFIFHYAENFTIPDKGAYTAKVVVKEPLFRRHDQVRGMRYTQEVEAVIGPVRVTPGQRPFGPE